MADRDDKYQIFRDLDLEYGSEAAVTFEATDARRIFENTTQRSTDSLVRARVQAASFNQ